MERLSRDRHDATHSLFVYDRPDAPARFVFVHERTGGVVTFLGQPQVGGAMVMRHPDGDPSVLTTTTDSKRLVRTQGEDLTIVHLSGPSLSISVQGRQWSIAMGDDTVQATAGAVSVTVQPHGTSAMEGAVVFDVWIKGQPHDPSQGLRVVAEALMIRRLADALSEGHAGR